MVKSTLVQERCEIFDFVSRSQMSPINYQEFSLCDLVLSLPYGDPAPLSEPVWIKSTGFGKARESCTIRLHGMVYCLSLFCHITGVMSGVGICAW